MAARSKGIYALSGLLKHNAPAVAALSFPEVNGWHKLHDALKGVFLVEERDFLAFTLFINFLCFKIQKYKFAQN